jgi:hypothetical protein
VWAPPGTQNMGTGLATGFDPSGPPFHRLYVHGVHRAPRPIQVALRAEFMQDQAVEHGPETGLAPLDEAPVHRRSGWPEHVRVCRQVHPDAATSRIAASTSRPPYRPPPPPCSRVGATGTNPLEVLPQLVRDQTIHDRHARTSASKPMQRRLIPSWSATLVTGPTFWPDLSRFSNTRRIARSRCSSG